MSSKTSNKHKFTPRTMTNSKIKSKKINSFRILPSLKILKNQ